MTHIASRNDDLLATEGAVDVCALSPDDALWHRLALRGRALLAEVREPFPCNCDEPGHNECCPMFYVGGCDGEGQSGAG